MVNQRSLTWQEPTLINGEILQNYPQSNQALPLASTPLYCSNQLRTTSGRDRATHPTMSSSIRTPCLRSLLIKRLATSNSCQVRCSTPFTCRNQKAIVGTIRNISRLSLISTSPPASNEELTLSCSYLLRPSNLRNITWFYLWRVIPDLTLSTTIRK